MITSALIKPVEKSTWGGVLMGSPNGPCGLHVYSECRPAEANKYKFINYVMQSSDTEDVLFIRPVVNGCACVVPEAGGTNAVLQCECCGMEEALAVARYGAKGHAHLAELCAYSALSGHKGVRRGLRTGAVRSLCNGSVVAAR